MSKRPSEGVRPRQRGRGTLFFAGRLAASLKPPPATPPRPPPTRPRNPRNRPPPPPPGWRAPGLPRRGAIPRGGAPAPPPHRRRTSPPARRRSEEHTSELQSLRHLVCRLLL